MVEFTIATGKSGIQGCLQNVVAQENIPKYAGIGVGAIAGNAVAKMFENYYMANKVDDGTLGFKVKRYAVRSVGRVAFSAAACAVSGSVDGTLNEVLASAAVGSTGVVFIDGIKTFAPVEIATYADLSGNSLAVSARKPAPTVIRARPTARLQGAVNQVKTTIPSLSEESAINKVQNATGALNYGNLLAPRVY